MATMDRKRPRPAGTPEPGRDRVMGPELPIPRHVHDAVERAAALRRGLALLHRAPPELVAAALGVHTLAVEEARARLEQAPQRERLIRIFAGALQRSRDQAPAADAPRPAPPRGPHELIAEAQRRGLGADFLRTASAETVAITFAVHPETVFRAREILAGRGMPPADPGEES